MRMAKRAWMVLIALSALSQAWSDQAPKDVQPQTRSKVTLDDTEERLGPFRIAGQAFTVILHNKNVVGAPLGRSQTLAKLEIQEHSGAFVYQRQFPYQLEGGAFHEVLAASARLLPGDNLTGLLVCYTQQPAPPDKEQAWQIFGFRNGKLALFDLPGRSEPAMNAPLQFTGVIYRAQNGAPPIPVSGPLDTVELRVWTGNFYVIVPMHVDWRNGKLMSGQRCLEAGAGGLHETGCDLEVQAERSASTAEYSFARVFPNPEESPGMGVQHVVIGKSSEVQLLKARSIVTWIEDGDTMRIALNNLWLKVLIDNNTDNEGWIHGEQDLAAIGLPARSLSQ
jgi:hypothetical protein